MTVLIHYSDVQIYTVSKSTIIIIIIFIVKGKFPWISLDGKTSKISIRKFYVRKGDWNLGWPLLAPVRKQYVKRNVRDKWQGVERGYEKTW